MEKDKSLEFSLFEPYKPMIVYCEVRRQENFRHYTLSKECNESIAMQKTIQKSLPCQGLFPCINVCENPNQMIKRYEKNKFVPITTKVREQLKDNYNLKLKGGKNIVILQYLN